MKTKIIIHWITTLLVVPVMTISGVLAVTQAPLMMKALDHLGSPAHFANPLGVAKLAGVCVLLAPGCLKLKEWYYARFRITIISAAYWHLLWGDGLMALDPFFFGNSDGILFIPVLPDAVGFPGRKLNFLVHHDDVNHFTLGAVESHIKQITDVTR